MENLNIKGKDYQLPIFLPDATRGVVKSIDSKDLEDCGIKGVVINTYHLMSSPGTEVIKNSGGIKDFMNFDGLVVSDSGGWQVFSLIHRNKMPGKITNSGVTFTVGNQKPKIFTPRKSVQVQFDLGSDIIICLDDFTPPDATREQAETTVDRTIRWAKASKREYEEQLEARKLKNEDQPHIFAVVQGGYFKDLRKKCAEELIKIGFDGYGYGGYVVDDAGNLDLKLSKYVCDILPDDKPKFALGVGKPHDIANLAEMGWDIFDCTLPTRDARHKRLVVFNKAPENTTELKDKNFFSYVYINKGKYKKDMSPISKFCSCHTCKNYSKSYLNHLFKIKDVSAFRLATTHNLQVYSTVLELLSKRKKEEKMNSNKNNKGFSLVMLVVVMGVLALVAVWYSLYNDSSSPINISKIAETIRKGDKPKVEIEDPFEDIPEDEFTPVEINNEALEELDNIMESITEEDLSDLSDL